MNKLQLISIIITVFSAGVTHAEPAIISIYKDYPISGNNINEIKEYIQNYGPKDVRGKSFAAETTPKFTWKYHFAESKSGCSIASMDVEVEITHQMPELINYSKLDGKTQNEWKTYYNATKNHEDGHVKIIKEAAKTLEWELVNMLPAPTCGEMARIANEQAFKILQNQDNANISYDLSSNHGAEQGAVL